jgi:Leucine-rich repeat (LRR) protein
MLRPGTSWVDITPLAECRSLRKLSLPYNSIADAGQLGRLGRLDALEFVDGVPLQNALPMLSEELRLQRFGLWRPYQMTGIDDLLNVPQLADLRFLFLDDADDLGSIAGVERWAHSLTGIFLHAPELADVTRLSSLRLLEFANLEGTPLRSLKFLDGFNKLFRLHIGGFDGPLPDLTPLCDLPALRHLHIHGDRFVDVSGLAQARQLDVQVIGDSSCAIYGEEKLSEGVVVRRLVTSR